VHAVEIKAGATMNSDYFKGLVQFKKTFPGQFLSGSVIYAGEQAQQRMHWQCAAMEIHRSKCIIVAG